MSRRKSLQQPEKRTEKHSPYKGTNEELRGEDNTKSMLQTNLNKPTYRYTRQVDNTYILRQC